MSASTAKKRGRPTKQSQQAARRAAQRKRRRQIYAVLVFALGLMLTALALVEGQSFWYTLHQGYFGLFSVCGFVLPAAVFYIAYLMAMGEDDGKARVRSIELAVLFLLLAAFIQVFFAGEIVPGQLPVQISAVYSAGVLLQGGGLVGMLLSLPLLHFLGLTGAKITIAVLLFVFVMIVTGLTLKQFFGAVSKPVKKAQEKAQEYGTELAARREERKKQREIDIDLGNGPDIDIDLGPSALAKEAVPEPVFKKELFTLSAAEPLPEPSAPADEKTAAEKLTMSKEEIEREITSTIREMKGDQPSSPLPPIDLLEKPSAERGTGAEEEMQQNAKTLEETLKSFGVQVRLLDAKRGPSVTRYELQPLAGVKISKITGLADDIALNLAASGVRIEAPIPGKAAVGIEVPNRKTNMVRLREVLSSPKFRNAKSGVTFALGKDIAGEVMTADIAKMPHLLIAGSTGSGKSVCINSMIISLLYKSTSDEVKLLMIDPKVVELGVYNGIPHLLVPVVTDPRKAAGALGWAVTEMLRRYKLFAENNVRDITGFNNAAKEKEELKPLPQIVIVIDELADLMMAAPNEVEDSICRLAQMARAAGMHLVIATQRPSVDVITGIIKANIPSRIAFAVSSQVDSRTILDGAGAEKLLGKGDMLFHPVGSAKPVRIQGCFVDDKEVERVVEFVKSASAADYNEEIAEEIEKQAQLSGQKKNGNGGSGGGFDEDSDMLMKAVECVIDAGQASTSYLQRRLKLGYARAARLIDEMEEKGFVGPYEGSKPRQVLISRQQFLEMKVGRPDSEQEYE